MNPRVAQKLRTRTVTLKTTVCDDCGGAARLCVVVDAKSAEGEIFPTVFCARTCWPELVQDVAGTALQEIEASLGRDGGMVADVQRGLNALIEAGE